MLGIDALLSSDNYIQDLSAISTDSLEHRDELWEFRLQPVCKHIGEDFVSVVEETSRPKIHQ